MPASDNKASLLTELRLMRLMLIVAAFVLFLDQLTKTIVRRIAVTSGTIEVIRGYFEISYLENTGVAFGLFPGQNTILIIIGFVAVGFVFAYYRRFKRNTWMKISLGLLLGGALGNLADRILLQRVTDFIRVRWWLLRWRWWPSFNIADAAVCVGAAMLVIGMLIMAQEVEHETRDAGNSS